MICRHFLDNGGHSRMPRRWPCVDNEAFLHRDVAGQVEVSTGVEDVPHLVLRVEAREDRGVGPMFPRTQEPGALRLGRSSFKVRTKVGNLGEDGLRSSGGCGARTQLPAPIPVKPSSKPLSPP